MANQYKIYQVVPALYPNLVQIQQGTLYDGDGNLITVIGQGGGGEGTQGPQGPSGPSGTVRNDSFSASVITITHSLGYYPVVQIIDNAGGVVMPLSISHSSVDTFTVDFGTAFSGYVITGAGAKGETGATGPQGFQGFQGYTGPQGFQGYTGERGPTGTGGVIGYYISAYDSTTQTNPTASTPMPMKITQVAESNGIVLSGSSSVFFQHDGTYNIQFSAQFDKTDAGNDDVDIWLRKNGNDIDDTNTQLTLSGNNAKAVPAWNWVLTLNSGDTLQIMWSSTDTNMRILAVGTQSTPNRPAIPSVIFTATQVMYTQIGPTGSTGVQGFQGPTGLQGDQGFQGPQGPAGSGGGGSGTTGSTGPQGTQGPTGSDGSQGNQGFQGPTGSDGSQGNQGFQGPTGMLGSAGSQGNQGPTGPQGSTGSTGSVGSQGFQGPTGSQGSQGFQGPTGSTGSSGVDGVAGGLNLFFNSSVASDVVPYRQLSRSTSGYGQTAIPVSLTQLQQNVLVDSGWMTDIGYPGVLVIPNGIWHMYGYFTKPLQTANLEYYFTISKYNGTSSQILFTSSQVALGWDTNSSTPVEVKANGVATTAVLSSSDRILVNVYLNNNDNAPRNASFYTEGANNYSYIVTTLEVQGLTGPQGSTGPQGFQGITGPQGDTGSQGFQGPTGPQGTNGTIGVNGATGEQGTTGPQGFQGTTGPQGDTGPQGTNGTIGVNGATGEQGPTGPQGNTGPQGTGSQGPAGPPGASTNLFNYYNFY